jgi:hypothetical protein
MLAAFDLVRRRPMKAVFWTVAIGAGALLWAGEAVNNLLAMFD